MISIPMISDFLKKIKKQVYDDAVDRLNYYYTPLILIFFALATSAKTFVGAPIQCWMPAEFKGGWEEYAEDYCFIKNTYYVPLHEEIPNDITKREGKEIGYYQWVPIFLAVQALLFIIPNQMWKAFCWQSGINFSSILSKSLAISKMTDIGQRENELKTLGSYVKDTLVPDRTTRHLARRTFLCFRFQKGRVGSYVSSLYIVVKLLYLVNVIGQFFLINRFLGTKYRFWGIEILNDLFHGREWQESGHFPRVTMCDLKVRKLGNIHNYSIQCVLMMNMFNEYIFIAMWFWLLFVAVATALNTLYWLLSTLPPKQRVEMVRKYIRVEDMDDYARGGFMDSDRVRRFVQHRLQPDGVLLLRFISGHAGDFTAMELTKQLYEECRILDQHKEHDSHYPRKIRSSLGSKGGMTDLVDSGSDSTKSTSPDRDGEFHETLYDPAMKKALNESLSGAHMPHHMSHPSAPMLGNGYPGPPTVPPKPKIADV